jgi:hypothetical protein
MDKFMTIWSDYPALTMMAVSLVALLCMYLLRSPAHGLISRSARLLHSQLRLLARACAQSSQRIRLRNYQVTKALAESLMERQLERRFMRIEELVERDLDNYQKLSIHINQQLLSINEDYEASASVPAAATEWIAAVDAIANLQGDERNSEVMSKILAEIHNTVKQHQRDALREHRWTVAARHKVLSGLRPQWRKLSKLLEHIDNNIDILRQRLRLVDKHMGQFEMLRAGVGHGIMSSLLMRFVIALCCVLVGATAAWINMQLLQQPLTQLMGQRQIGALPLGGLISLLHVGITLTAATMITESLRITHFFPLIGAMTKRGRNALIIVGSGLLLLLITIEVMALSGMPVGTQVDQLSVLSQWILVALALVMPVMLSLVVIPLEYLLHTVRPVVGSVVQILLHLLALLLRLLASFSLNVGKLAVHGYDMLIFLPLRWERQWRARQQAERTGVYVERPLVSTADDANVRSLRFGRSERR